MTAPRWVHDDGGRAAAGRRGAVGDCVVRSVAIAARLPYEEAYAMVRRACAGERRARGRSTPCLGVHRRTYERVLLGELGARWVPMWGPGAARPTRLRAGEVPARGRYVLVLAGHLAALVDGVVHDTHDPSRGGRALVYGWYKIHAARRMS